MSIITKGTDFTNRKARPRKLNKLNQTNKQNKNNSLFDKNATVVNPRLRKTDERCLSSNKTYSETVNYEDPQVMQGSFTEDFSMLVFFFIANRT